MTRVSRSLGLSIGAALLCAAALAGCSGGSDPEPAADAGSAAASTSPAPVAGTASAAATPYLPVPAGVRLTTQGSQLVVPAHAEVAYRPRQGQVGVLDIAVTRLDATTFKQSFQGWELSAATRKAAPYFVHATVTNDGRTDLGGRRVPLYVVDGDNTLIESSSFSSSFTPCPSTPLPAKFPTGAKADVCLVYLVPEKGDLTAVSFRPTEDFNPIVWTGKLTSPEPVKKSAS